MFKIFLELDDKVTPVTINAKVVHIDTGMEIDVTAKNVEKTKEAMEGLKKLMEKLGFALPQKG